MTNRNDRRLEAMLRYSKTEAPSNDLAERIIAAARQVTQKQASPMRFGLRNIFAELHIRQPVSVLSFTLLLGLAIGFATTKLNNPVHFIDIAIQMDYLDSFLYGDAVESDDNGQ